MMFNPKLIKEMAEGAAQRFALPPEKTDEFVRLALEKYKAVDKELMLFLFLHEWESRKAVAAA